MKQVTWTVICNEIKADIRAGRLSAGDQLPTETQLATRFESGRHSVRRALEALAREGKISIEQGRGTFVADTPRLTYQIGKRTRLRRNLIPQGVDVTSELISAARIKAPDNVAQALLLNARASVIENQRITLANDLPVAFGASYHCAERFSRLAPQRTGPSVTQTFFYEQTEVFDPLTRVRPLCGQQKIGVRETAQRIKNRNGEFLPSDDPTDQRGAMFV
ncbi:MAG: GntR family transcriptional regulator, partial [Pseudomonadota bacterium]